MTSAFPKIDAEKNYLIKVQGIVNNVSQHINRLLLMQRDLAKEMTDILKRIQQDKKE